MKKRLTALILAFCMVITAVPALAQNAIQTVSDLYDARYRLSLPTADEMPISIMYNGELLDYGTDFVMQNDTIMVPAQRFFETIGAEAKFSGTKADVTRGELNAVFTDDTVAVTANGKTDTYTMQQKPMEQDGILYYPIRNMAEAFGIQVVWDGFVKTAGLVDIDRYIEELETTAPSFYALMQKEMATYNRTSGSYTIKLDLSGPEDARLNAKMDIEENSVTKDQISASSMQIDLNLKDIASFLNETDVQWPNLTNVSFDLILDGYDLYIRTDLFEQLADGMDNKEFKLIGSLIDRDKWIKLDLKQFLKDYLYMSDAELDRLLNMADSKQTGMDMLKNMFSEGPFNNVYTLATIDTVFEVYKQMDEYITLKETEDGYETTIKMTGEDIVDLVNQLIPEMNEKDIQEMRDMLIFDIDVSSTVNSAESDSKMLMKVGLHSDTWEMVFTMEGTQKAEVDEEVELPEIPQRAVDLNALYGNYVYKK